MEKLNHNYNKLLGLMKEKRISQMQLAAEIGTTTTTLNLKLNGKADFKLSEIKSICNSLEISAEKISEYFFN